MFAQHNRGFATSFSAASSLRRETMVGGALPRASAFRVGLGVGGTVAPLDGIQGVVPGLVPGFQGCKNPGSLGKIWDQTNSLKFILIDSNFLISPVLRPPVTLGVSRVL
jgi:hypothetical protein